MLFMLKRGEEHEARFPLYINLDGNNCIIFGGGDEWQTELRHC